MTTQLHYEITFNVGGVSLRDINYCAFIRSPIIKQSGFCIMEAFVSQVMVRQMQSDITRNNFPSFTMSVYSDDQISTGQLQNIFTKTFMCINISVDRMIRFEEDRIHATFLLVHPIIYYIANNNTFNQIFLDTTAYGVLGAYQGFLSSEFGDIFQWNHIGAGVNQNSYIYEQILTRASNDLSIPDYLINTYKVNNSFCYYFFDPFYMDVTCTNEITCHYINLMANDQFIQQDIHEFFDKHLMLNHVQTRQFADVHNTFIGKIGHRFIMNHRDIKSDYEKLPIKMTLEKKLSPIINEYELIKNRKIKSVTEKSIIGHPYAPTSATSSFYCPDTIGNGHTRFDNAISLLQNKIMSIEIYEISNCIVEFPQFGYKYNLEDFNDTQYNHTPISIINIFNRKNYKESYLYHLAQVSFLRYKNE